MKIKDGMKGGIVLFFLVASLFILSLGIRYPYNPILAIPIGLMFVSVAIFFIIFIHELIFVSYKITNNFLNDVRKNIPILFLVFFAYSFIGYGSFLILFDNPNLYSIEKESIPSLLCTIFSILLFLRITTEFYRTSETLNYVHNILLGTFSFFFLFFGTSAFLSHNGTSTINKIISLDELSTYSFGYGIVFVILDFIFCRTIHSNIGFIKETIKSLERFKKRIFLVK
jgi:hypothetical protein